ncbi:MAG: PilZ domain-containing protein [Candidatus Omnitrophota bacterium]
MIERRKHQRKNVEIPVKCFLVDDQKHKRRKISYELISKIGNLSQGGFCLLWPKKWNCEPCSKCLAWIFNHNCKLKEGVLLENRDRYLPKSIFLKVKLDPPFVREPEKLMCKVEWIQPEETLDEYRIGISFLENQSKELRKLQ